MTYDDLDKIPIVLFFKVAETGYFSLLSDEITDLQELENIWLKLFNEHQSRNSNKESDKEFRLEKEISALEAEYTFVCGAIVSLGFEINDDLISDLKEKRYIVRTESTDAYYDSLELIQRSSKSFKIKIDHIRSMMPKKDENKKETEKFSIYDTIASYTRIMGYDLDYETVSYSKFYAVQKQVHLKIESEIKKATINK